jgi:hypothetical protein
MEAQIWPMIAGLVAISFGVLGLWKRDWLVRAIEFVGSVYSQRARSPSGSRALSSWSGASFGGLWPFSGASGCTRDTLASATFSDAVNCVRIFAGLTSARIRRDFLARGFAIYLIACLFTASVVGCCVAVPQ